MNGTCQCEEGWSGISCNDTITVASGSGASNEDLLYPNETSLQPTNTLTPTNVSTSHQTTTTTDISTTNTHWSSSVTPSSSQRSTMLQSSTNSAKTQSTSSTDLKINSTNSSNLSSNSTCSPDHQRRTTILLGVLLALLTLGGHFLLCLCSRRSNSHLNNRAYSKMKRIKPVKRRRLRRKRRPAFVPVKQESSSDCSI